MAILVVGAMASDWTGIGMELRFGWAWLALAATVLALVICLWDRGAVGGLSPVLHLHVAGLLALGLGLHQACCAAATLGLGRRTARGRLCSARHSAGLASLAPEEFLAPARTSCRLVRSRANSPGMFGCRPERVDVRRFRQRCRTFGRPTRRRHSAARRHPDRPLERWQISRPGSPGDGRRRAQVVRPSSILHPPSSILYPPFAILPLRHSIPRRAGRRRNRLGVAGSQPTRPVAATERLSHGDTHLDESLLLPRPDTNAAQVRRAGFRHAAC